MQTTSSLAEKVFDKAFNLSFDYGKILGQSIINTMNSSDELEDRSMLHLLERSPNNNYAIS